MPDRDRRRLERHFTRLENHLPSRLVGGMRRLRRPGLKPVRIIVGTLLIVGGTFGMLPILGFWMAPLGLLLLAQDIPALRRGVGRLLVRIRHHHRRARRRY